MQIHEAANIFPLDEEHIDELANDIQQNGQKVAIELLDGKVIDGRRRLAACKKAGVVPDTREVFVEDPVAYVLSLNLHRRHLTPSQLSMVGARARDIYDRQAKERQSSGLKKGQQKPVQANLPEREMGQSRDAVGKTVGVSGKSIDYATRVLEKGTPELVKAVDDGRMAISTAAILASEPAEVQVEEVSKPKRQRKYLAGEGGCKPTPQINDPAGDDVIERRGVGVIRANEAINCLIRIPKNDALRKRGFQLVTDWIKKNR